MGDATDKEPPAPDDRIKRLAAVVVAADRLGDAVSSLLFGKGVLADLHAAYRNYVWARGRLGAGEKEGE